MKRYDFLRMIALFADMPDADLLQLCDTIEEVRLDAGQVLFREGDIGDKAYIIQAGELEILKKQGQKDVRLALRGEGEVIGEMSLLQSEPRSASVQARTGTTLLVISQQGLDLLLARSPSAARALLKTIGARLRATNQMLQETEKLAQLGTLTAGIAHELNNPAAAIIRSSSQFQELMNTLSEAMLSLAESGLNRAQIEAVQTLLQRAQRLPPGPPMDPLDRIDEEDALTELLHKHHVPDAAEHAATFADVGFNVSEIEPYTRLFPGETFAHLVLWLCPTAATFSLVSENQQAAKNISVIIKALKSYVYLDQGSLQSVNLEEGLESTMVVLRYKLKQGVQVVREYDPQLPNIQAYGGELNQVWTNLIDNAIDAMHGEGRLVVRTRREDQHVVVEIEDNGPGIPAEVRPRLFTPFFTTKPQGQGTGLGLSISYNIVQKHGGSIEVNSQPGQTCFIVRLPIDHS